jgi:2-polyprenyl-6-methoxyphenol hydroxylase-like FAD-dependent oxidoreductase
MYDVIVVGARLTGAATALLLARAGHRVLLLDRADLSRDRTRNAATNLIHPPGVRLLRDWGVLDQVLAGGCPAIERYGLWTGPVGFAAEIPPSGHVRHAYSPSRSRLDAVLLDAAGRAGAEVRDRVSVTGLRYDDSTDRVNGVIGRLPSGLSFRETGTVVVGADGSNSRVAAAAGAAEHDRRGVLSKSLWAYWEGLPHDGVARTFRLHRRHCFTWPTHDGLSIVGVAWPTGSFAVRRGTDADTAVREAFDDAAPGYAPLLRTARRAGEWMLGSVPNFRRDLQGPGWVLAGDAGYTRDPITAAGITEGLRAAEVLTKCLEASFRGDIALAAALHRYERVRSAETAAYYAYTCDYAEINDFTRRERQFIGALSLSDAHARGLVGVFARTVPAERYYSRASLHPLFAGLPADGPLDIASPALRWLLRRPEGGRWQRLADHLIAAQLRSMGPLLLSDGPGGPERLTPFEATKGQ